MKNKSNVVLLAMTPVAVTSIFLTVFLSFSVLPVHGQNATTVLPTNATTVLPTNATTVLPTNATTVLPTNATTVLPTNVTGKYQYEPFNTLKDSKFQDLPANLSPQLTKFSIVTWFKTSHNYTEPGHMVNKGGMGSDETGMNMNYGLWITDNNEVEGGFEATSGDNFFVKTPNKYNDGKWHHAAVTYNGSAVSLYVDGKQIGKLATNNATIDNTGTQPLRIGANSLNLDKFFTGDIDEIRLWDRPLTLSEVEKAYTENKFNTTGQVFLLSYGGYKQ